MTKKRQRGASASDTSGEDVEAPNPSPSDDNMDGITMFNNSIFKLENILNGDKRKLSSKSPEILELLTQLKSEFNAQTSTIENIKLENDSLREQIKQSNATLEGLKAELISPGLPKQLKYSTILQKNQTSVTNNNIRKQHTILVYPKKTSLEKIKSSKATEQLLKTSISLEGVPVCVRSCKLIGGNGMSITCRDKNAATKLSNVINKHKDLESKIPEKRRPVLTFLLSEK